MVWSSARPENVYKMCEQLFTPQQLQQLVAIWSRDMLRLGRFHHSNVQVYKNLDWIWEFRAIQATATSPYLPWTQHNTVLVDDTSAKAASQPFNLINVDEFEKRPEQMHSDVLHQVVTYLDTLSWQDNVSAYMRAMPFQPNKR
nr:uncharacterized FCP1 homology domain-containing protein C1271.03c-like [Quercus suber]POE83822.1 putative fcp1 likey domain-containing protein [Quercus suber]